MPRSPRGPALSEFMTWLQAQNYSASTIYVYTAYVRGLLADLPSLDAAADPSILRGAASLRAYSTRITLHAAWMLYRDFVIERGGPVLPDIVEEVTTTSPRARHDIAHPTDLPERVEDCVAFLLTGGSPHWNKLVTPAILSALRWRAWNKDGHIWVSWKTGFPATIPLLETLTNWARQPDGGLNPDGALVPAVKGGLTPAAIETYKRAVKHARGRPALSVLLARENPYPPPADGQWRYQRAKDEKVDA